MGFLRQLPGTTVKIYNCGAKMRTLTNIFWMHCGADELTNNIQQSCGKNHEEPQGQLSTMIGFPLGTVGLQEGNQFHQQKL